MYPYRAWTHCLARLQATWRLGVCGQSASARPTKAAVAASAAWASSWRRSSWKLVAPAQTCGP
eukprot:1848643-Alexandrium_andersonii.AAC.1